jgi:hypothetical protein
MGIVKGVREQMMGVRTDEHGWGGFLVVRGVYEKGTGLREEQGKLMGRSNESIVGIPADVWVIECIHGETVQRYRLV